MNGHNDTLPNELPSNEDLSAYLDGELDADSRRRIEEQLSASGELRQRLKEYQEAWDLLDELPRADVDDSFTRTTVEMVAIRAEDQAASQASNQGRRQKIRWAMGMAASLLVGLGGYAMTLQILNLPNEQLVEDLPILEHFDAYQNAGTVDFLRQMHEQKLFQEDSSDAL